MHPDLIKLHCETAAKHSYRSSQEILNKQVCGKRKINNHERFHHVIGSVGQHICDTIPEEIIASISEAKELIIQVDGGHIKDKNPEQRSFEVMTAVIYQPQHIERHATSHLGKITQKHCSASAMDANNR